MDDRFGMGAAQQYDEYLEGFFDDVVKTVRAAAPIVANVAGGVARGAMTGSSLGLPGIIGGAIAGGAGTALSSYAHGPLRDVGNVVQTGMHVASQLTPQGRMGDTIGSAVSGIGRGGFTPRAFLQQGVNLAGGLAGGAGGSAGGLAGLLGGGGAGGLGRMLGGAASGGAPGGGAASSLFSLISRPEVQQALTAMNLGPAGRTSIPVGAAQTPVPTAAIAGLLHSLAGQAVDEAAAESDGSEASLAYMFDASGGLLGDPGLADDRDARVLALLGQAHADRLQSIAQQQFLQQVLQAAQVAPAECPHCIASRTASPRSRFAGALTEAWDYHVAEDYAEDYTEDFAEDAGEDFGEDFGEFWLEDISAHGEGEFVEAADEALDEAFDEDAGESLDDLIRELPHAYA